MLTESTTAVVSKQKPQVHDEKAGPLTSNSNQNNNDHKQVNDKQTPPKSKCKNERKIKTAACPTQTKLWRWHSANIQVFIQTLDCYPEIWKASHSTTHPPLPSTRSQASKSPLQDPPPPRTRNPTSCPLPTLVSLKDRHCRLVV
ncbi:unnamed protein product [Lota lota]